MWDLPTWAGGLLTTAPPGKSLRSIFLKANFHLSFYTQSDKTTLTDYTEKCSYNLLYNKNNL